FRHVPYHTSPSNGLYALVEHGRLGCSEFPRRCGRTRTSLSVLPSSHIEHSYHRVFFTASVRSRTMNVSDTGHDRHTPPWRTLYAPSYRPPVRHRTAPGGGPRRRAGLYGVRRDPDRHRAGLPYREGRHRPTYPGRLRTGHLALHEHAHR